MEAHRAMPALSRGQFSLLSDPRRTNTCYDHLRRQKRHAAVSLDELVDEVGMEIPAQAEDAAIDPAWAAMQNESMALILREIDALPPWHRNVVLWWM